MRAGNVKCGDRGRPPDATFAPGERGGWRMVSGWARGAARRTGALLAVLAAASAVGTAPGAASAQTLPDVQQVIDRLDDLYRSQSSHSVMTMTVVRDRGTRELTLEAWSKGDEEMLVVIREPSREAGTATLRTKEGLWNYAPRADRLIRIPRGLLSEAWMGSHFTNDDLMRETSFLDDYEASLSTTERDGRRYLQATLVPRPDAPVVYTRLVYLLTPDEWLPVLAEYYDEDEVVRTLEFSDVRTVAGRRIPMVMELRPADEGDEFTRMAYSTLEFDLPVDDDLFTRRGLRRVARQ